MSTKEKVLAQIDELVSKQTFSLEALEGIKSLKDSLDEITVERDLYKSSSDRYSAEVRNLSITITTQTTQISKLEKEIESMKALLESGKKAIYEAEKYKAVADTWQSAMSIVFKPNTVRESIQRSHSMPIPSGAYYHQATDSEIVTKEDS